MSRPEIFSDEWMLQFQQLINQDKELSWIGRFFDCKFLWKIGERSYLFHMKEGKALSIRQSTWNDSWDFTIEGSLDTWRKFAEPFPPPMYYDLLGIVTRHSDCSLTGNRLKAMQNVRSLVRLFQIVREVK